MKILYLDFGMGVSGDMLAGALLDIVEDRDAVIEEFNKLGIPGVTASYDVASKCGITGVKATILVDGEEEGHAHGHDHHHDHGHDHDHDHGHDHHHHHDHAHPHDHDHHHGHAHSHSHNGIAEIEHIVNGHLDLRGSIKSDILAVFGEIAEAESRAHGMPVPEVHFHEVGTMDAVADVTLVSMLIDRIGADRIIATPINTGSGTVKCAHGILPVPAPATALILEGIPSYSNGIMSELCTPTGAALAKHFVTEFGNMPPMITEAIGYGMGHKDFDACNAVRATLGTEASFTAPNESIHELSCNIDDMTGEELAFALERILEAGAVDAWLTPIIMKKSRPATMLSALTSEEQRHRVIDAIFKHTTTLGIRIYTPSRYVLERKVTELDTPLGKIRCKTSEGPGTSKCKYEYDDLCEIALREGLSLREVKRSIEHHK